jgi:hypothetical protein
VPTSPAQHRAQPVPPVLRGGRIRPLYPATPPKLTARVALDHGSHATRGRTRSDAPGAPDPAGGSDACSRSGGRFAGRSSELADAHTKAVVAPRLRPAATSPLPGMEGGSGGIAAALRQMQERRERRSCAGGRVNLVHSGRLALDWPTLATTPKAAVTNPRRDSNSNRGTTIFSHAAEAPESSRSRRRQSSSASPRPR